MKKYLIFLLFAPLTAFSADAIYLPNLPGYATGTNLGGGHYGLDISGTITASNPSVSTTGAAVPASGTYVAASKAGLLTGLLVGQQTMANSMACVLPSDQSAIPVTGTFWQATQPISAASLPLPTGAATSANQTNGSEKSQVVNSSGTSVDAKTLGTQVVSTDVGMVVNAVIHGLNSGGGGTYVDVKVNPSGALVTDGSGTTQPVSGTFWQATQPVSGTFWQATQPVSAASLPLPTGAATSANQTTANTSLSTIATNSGKIPPNLNAAFSQTSVTTTASTVTAPANAVRVMVQGDSSNTDCIRYRFDGTAATATVGVVAQAGQDSGQLDSGMSVSVAACSGTQKVNVQYLAQ